MKLPRDLKAIAVEYGNKSAPTVVARGTGAEAKEMVELAADANKPVIKDPDLISSMECLELNEEIPEELPQKLQPWRK